jgi:hypothetical protein
LIHREKCEDKKPIRLKRDLIARLNGEGILRVYHGRARAVSLFYYSMNKVNMISTLKDQGKNELVRHLLATLVYRITKIINDAPPNYQTISIGNNVRTPEKVLGHINSLIQLCNRFWSPDKPISLAIRRKETDKKGWEMEIELFLILVSEFDATLEGHCIPRKYSPEKIL